MFFPNLLYLRENVDSFLRFSYTFSLFSFPNRKELHIAAPFGFSANSSKIDLLNKAHLIFGKVWLSILTDFFK